MKMQQNISLSYIQLLSRLIKLMVIIIFCVFTSSFNTNKKNIKEASSNLKEIVVEWYDIFLQLESKDETAHPPISSLRIAYLGLCAEKYYSAYSNEINNNNKLYINGLHLVYAKALQNVFVSKTELTYPIIEERLHLVSEENLLLPKNAEQRSVTKKIEEIVNEVRCILPIEYSTYEPCASTDNALNYNGSQCVFPNWGSKETVAIDKHAIDLRLPFDKISKDNLYNEALFIYTKSLELTQEDKWIGDFWSDDVRGLTFSPAGRWISIANQLVLQNEMTNVDVFELYKDLGIGMHDAIVLCWYYKYKYNICRPSAYVQSYIDPKWVPLHVDPMFPSFPSGHATLGAVSSVIMEHYFGKGKSFTDYSHQGRIEFYSNHRSFTSLYQMAEENAYSRVVLGVHYLMDGQSGLQLGKKVAKLIIENKSITTTPLQEN